MRGTNTFSVHVVVTGDVAVVVLAGELDIAAVAGFEAVFRATLMSGPAQIVVDLDAVALIDAQGLGALLRARRRGSGSGIRVGLVRPSAECRRFLTMIRLERLIDTADPALVGG